MCHFAIDFEADETFKTNTYMNQGQNQRKHSRNNQEVESNQGVCETISQLVKLHTEAGMQLCKWALNSDYALQDLGTDQRAKERGVGEYSSRKGEPIPSDQDFGLDLANQTCIILSKVCHLSRQSQGLDRSS